MRWSNVKLILAREIRDQLRDRRTLFMIAVLPLLLYPLMGMSFFQVVQFMRERAIRVLVVGTPRSTDLPPLVKEGQFVDALFSDPAKAALVKVTTQPPGTGQSPGVALAAARAEMQRGNFEVVVYFPPDFDEKIGEFQQLLRTPAEQTAARDQTRVPSLEIYPNLAKDSSRVAYRRVSDVLDRWREQIGQRNLKDSHLPILTAKPFDIDTKDVADSQQHKAAMWSRILPLVLLLWALTGAFYPAIDLCAGEKERGTLETLLSSPAERIEIVWGKLLTVMVFSMATAALNLGSMGVTGSFVFSQLPNLGPTGGMISLGPPPPIAILWLLVALLPISALFSALCIALAALARSTKEGQYYLMPLVLVTLPLTILPMAPGVELNLGNSLIPVTGVVLLLRAMLEGEYAAAVPYIPTVTAVTLGCCWLAIRWATNQFSSESVLFRESERWDMGTWIKHLVRDRQSTPSFSEAVFCGMLILLLRFFVNFAVPAPRGFDDLAVITAVTQLVVIFTPAVLMATMLTRGVRQTLLLRQPKLSVALAAVLLAVAIQPAHNLLQTIVSTIYPLDEQVAAELNRLLGEPGNPWIMLLAFALLPAICEELAFRGFILSGLRRGGRKWTAIVISSVFFGAAHTIFQQSLIASLTGMVIGFVAIQSGSLIPCVLFHAVHNSINLLMQYMTPLLADERHPLRWLMRDAGEKVSRSNGLDPLYHWPLIAVSIAVSGAILYWFHRLPYSRTPEESLQEAIDHQSAHLQLG